MPWYGLFLLSLWLKTPGSPLSQSYPYQGIRVNLAGFVFLAVQKTLARAWRQPLINIAEVKQRLMGIMVHEKLSSILEDTHTHYLKVWSLWIDFTAQTTIDHNLLSLWILFGHKWWLVRHPRFAHEGPLFPSPLFSFLSLSSQVSSSPLSLYLFLIPL